MHNQPYQFQDTHCRKGIKLLNPWQNTFTPVIGGIIMLVLMLTFLQANAAISTDSLIESRLKNRHTIRWSYLHIYNLFPTLQMQYERHLVGDNTINFDIGMVMNYNNYEGIQSIQQQRGTKLRLSVRHYLDIKEKRSGDAMFYLAPEILFNALSRESGRFFQYTLGSGEQYFRYHDYTKLYRESALGLRVGRQRIYRSGITLDINAGLAYWMLRTRYKNFPQGADSDFVQEDNILWLEVPRRGQNRFTVMPLLGFNLGYSF
ncbi:MAG: hypothetical protein JJU28_14590 [Cyclobacteriaceae bacterium]|nr:hypothetical protein [Cyclobacteriaceae bacterium]